MHFSAVENMQINNFYFNGSKMAFLHFVPINFPQFFFKCSQNYEYLKSNNLSNW
jgi:hypothetical protein